MRPLDALRALGPGSEPPAEVKHRVAGALYAALEAAAAAPLLTKTSGPASVHPAQTSLLGGVAGSKVLAMAVGIWVAGGVAGAGLYRALRPPEVRIVYVQRPAPAMAVNSSSTPPEAVPSAPSLLNRAPSSAASARTTLEQARGSAGAESNSELARERAVLDAARADAAHGEPAQALAVTERHRQQFPRGRLSEEREALAIRALLSLGRTAEARERAAAFRSTYPGSFLLPALESALSEP